MAEKPHLTSHSLNIRRARPEDAGVILSLIKELAEYEKEPDAVLCTEDDILRDGFGPVPRFTCLLADLDQQTVAFALYFMKWSTWTGSPCLHLEDLFVKPAFRGHKVGFSLLVELAGIAVAEGCDRFEWDVLDWNTLARDFYEALGAGPKEGWLTYRLEGEALAHLADRHKAT